MATITKTGKPVKQCTVNTEIAGERYQTLSSDGETWYNVDVDERGELHCACPARLECYHIRTVRPICNTDRWQAWAAVYNAKAVAKGIVPAARVEAEQPQAVAARRERAERAKAELNGAPLAAQQVHTLGNGSTFTGTVATGDGWL